MEDEKSNVKSRVATFGDTSEPASERVNPENIKLQYMGNPSAPMVILFGPPSSGKTVGLIRLLRYLKAKGYEIKILETLRTDAYFEDVLLPRFKEQLKSDDIPKANAVDNFMAIEIKQGDRVVCTFFELPGEYLYDTGNANNAHENIPSYLYQIRQSPGKKIVYFLVPLPSVNSMALDADHLRNYFNHIVHTARFGFDMKANKYIFLTPKADLYPGTLIKGRDSVISGAAYEQLRYLDGFDAVTQMLTDYNMPFEALAYSAGLVAGNQIVWSGDYWPELLWQNIQKNLGEKQTKGLFSWLF
jgi:hypothetical protein